MKRSGLVLSALIFTIAASSEASTLTFTTIDHPAALSDDGTLLFGVNGNGEIVGSYLDAVTFNRHSFSYIGGVFTPLDYPSASSTAASDISNSGQIVGTYFDGNSSHGFLKIGNTYSSIDDPAASGFDTAVNAINGNGDLGGVYYTDQFTYHGFVYSGGSFATFDIPGAQVTAVTGINNQAQFVGTYLDGAFNYRSYLNSGGVVTPISFPGATQTFVTGINNNGQTVGYYVIGGSNPHGFLFDGSSYVTVDYPGSGYTSIFGLNDNGDMVGRYYFTAAGVPPEGHGFLAAAVETPEPGSLALMGFGVALLVLCSRRLTRRGRAVDTRQTL